MVAVVDVTDTAALVVTIGAAGCVVRVNVQLLTLPDPTVASFRMKRFQLPFGLVPLRADN